MRNNYYVVSASRSELKTLLTRWCEGDREAGNQLVAEVYPDLRRLAAHYLRDEAPGHTLQPTALVHELYLRLFSADAPQLHDRAHFFALVARQLRHIVIDLARKRRAAKRGGGARVSLSDLESFPVRDDDLFALDRELTKLDELDPRSAQVVELRFFGGLGDAEIAQVLGISIATVKRDWDFARAWLLNRLGGS
jgi:RNA polymerase sigma factor (TIGR02999 family)